MILIEIVKKTNNSGLSEYFCDANMQVTLNEEAMSLDKFQQELRKIRDDRKIRNLEISTEKDSAKNCIKTMNIKLDRKGHIK